ncbi:MAG: SpoIIIAH-like family protein [Clostridia bacterium]|nr:SpoIIIAH-like family protein [Clostridia bacterium]
MTFGKRQLVIASLVVALGAAVYLNWQFSSTEPITAVDTEESSVKQLGQTTYVNTEVSTTETSSKESSKSESSKASSATKKDDSKSETSTKAVNAEQGSDSGHFAAEREKRNDSDAKAVEALTDVIEAASSSESAKKEAVKAAEKLAANIKAQSDIENEVKSKGFDDVFAAINNENCNVTVYGGTLDDAAAISIKDIVNRQAGISFDKITVAQASNSK